MSNKDTSVNIERKDNNRSIDWLELIVGILLIISGIFILSNLFESYIGLASIFGVLIIIRGIVAIVRSVRRRRLSNGAVPGVIGIIFGILAIVLGIYLSFNPGMSAVLIGQLVGIYFIIEGVQNIIQSGFTWALNPGISIISILLNIFLIFAGSSMLWNWGTGGLTISAMLGITAIIGGVFLIIEAFTD